MKKLLIPAIVFVSLTLGTSCGENKQQTDSTEVAKDSNEEKSEATSDADSTNANSIDKDKDFAVEAASGGLMEVELGKLAATNASSADVKKFGQQMVTDHSKANDELKSLATAKNITLPTTPGEKHQKHIDDLKSLKGADFDKAYISMMVDDHEEDVSKFEKEGNDGNDAELKAFAAGKVPTLKHHLEMAKSIKDKQK
jgi:putative membrane protein